MDWSVELVASPEEFLTRTASFRIEHPMETNIIGSIATAIAGGSKTYSAYFFWVVFSGREVAGIALRTVPFRLLVSTMPAGAAQELAKKVLAIDPDCWGVTGPEDVASEFIESWCNGTGRKLSDFPIHMRETTYVLGEHTPLAGVKGVSRKANNEDLPLLLKWFPAFAKEVGLSHTESPSKEDLRGRLSATAVVIWEVNERAVAMSGHSALVEGSNGKIARIGPVYTEPAERGFGYGAAVTSAMIEHLYSIGCATVMLYADSNYEKSNRVYQHLGFRPVGAIVEFGLEPSTNTQK